MRRPVVAAIVLSLATSCAVHALTPGSPTSYPAVERGLLEPDVTAQLLVEEGNNYYKAVAKRNFQGSVLGYVTPWNSHGYDVAKKFRAKFTHISPVWYQLRGPAEDGDATGLQLTGSHDVDKGWIAELRAPVTKESDCADGDSVSETCAANFDDPQSPPLVVPRVIVELEAKVLVGMLQQPGEAIALLVDEVEKHGFDGLVFECWMQWTAMGVFSKDRAKGAALAFIRKLAVNLKEQGKVLILPIPPLVPAHPQLPSAKLEHLMRVADDVAGFNIMTYDYSHSSAGPNGPLPWQEQNLQEMMGDEPDPDQEESDRAGVPPPKVLMGINFYGVDFIRPDTKSKDAQFERKPMLAEAFLSVLGKASPKLTWDEESAEHRIKYKEAGLRHTVYFPTPTSIAARIDKATELGVGIAIWDLGQGMDSFLDLL